MLLSKELILQRYENIDNREKIYLCGKNINKIDENANRVKEQIRTPRTNQEIKQKPQIKIDKSFFQVFSTIYFIMLAETIS